MEENREKEDFYLIYQSKSRQAEQEWEDWNRNWRKFEAEKEDSRLGMQEDSQKIQELAADWGLTEESNRMLSMVEDSIKEEKQEWVKQEEQLLTEKRRIIKEREDNEDAYREQLRYQEEESWE